jgi:hypothetical protein
MLLRNPTTGKQEINLVPRAHCLVSSSYEYYAVQVGRL